MRRDPDNECELFSTKWEDVPEGFAQVATCETDGHYKCAECVLNKKTDDWKFNNEQDTGTEDS